MSPSRMCSLAASTARGPVGFRKVRPYRGKLRELVGGRDRGLVRQRPAQLGDRGVQTFDRGVVQRVQRGVVTFGRRIHVLDQEAPLAEVVERRDLTRERADRVGKPEVVGRHVGQPFDLADGVVADPPDDPTVEGRQLGLRRARDTAPGVLRAPRASPDPTARLRAASRRSIRADVRARRTSARARVRGTRTSPTARRARRTRAGTPHRRRPASRRPRAVSRDPRAPRATPGPPCTRALARRTSRSSAGRRASVVR